MSTYAADRARAARKIVTLQVMNYRGEWETVGHYKVGGRPYRLACRDAAREYRYYDIRTLEGRH